MAIGGGLGEIKKDASHSKKQEGRLGSLSFDYSFFLFLLHRIISTFHVNLCHDASYENVEKQNFKILKSLKGQFVAKCAFVFGITQQFLFYSLSHVNSLRLHFNHSDSSFYLRSHRSILWFNLFFLHRLCLVIFSFLP